MTPREWRYLADENIDPAVVESLRKECDVASVAERGLFGRTDSEILSISLAEQRVVLTHDSDFGRLAIRRQEPIHGIVYLRPGHAGTRWVVEVVQTLLASGLDLRIPFLVVAERREGRVRLRSRQL